MAMIYFYLIRVDLQAGIWRCTSSFSWSLLNPGGRHVACPFQLVKAARLDASTPGFVEFFHSFITSHFVVVFVLKSESRLARAAESTPFLYGTL